MLVYGMEIDEIDGPSRVVIEYLIGDEFIRLLNIEPFDNRIAHSHNI